MNSAAPICNPAAVPAVHQVVKTLIIAATCLAIVGCNSEDAQNISQDAKSLAQHTGEALSGMTLGTKVKTALSLRKDVDSKDISIDAQKDGSVTLGGHVRSSEERDRAVDVVAHTVGVEKVVDNIKVQP